MSEKERVLVADALFSGEKVSGEVGIEVEVEGRNLPTKAGGYWTVTRDGSLRGEEALEYVLSKPIPREEVDKALSDLYGKFESPGLVLDDSGRAGVHIHINIRDLTVSELYTFIFLYLILERPLVDFCGKERVGNLFCLRAVDAEYLLIALRQLVETHSFREVGNDNLRYAAMNLTAIRKYGSLEFRTMASPVAKEKIQAWATTLLAIKDAVKQFKSPEEVVYGVSNLGGVDFAKSVLGECFPLIACEDWDEEVVFGMRLIQPIVNNFSKENLEAAEIKWAKAKEIPVEPPRAVHREYPRAMVDVAQAAIREARGETRFGHLNTL